MEHFFDKLKDKAHHLFDEVLKDNDDDGQDDERERKYTTELHRYESFAPVRHGAEAKFFIDGHDYCWAVSEAIDQAKHVVFIEDWWLYLRRPPADFPEFRIDALLKRKAEEGVKIFVVIYKEVPMAMTLDSEHTKKHLQDLHENIVVQRHPDHDLGGTFFWSHHEKFVIVDNRIAFLGGIDLCFGRWDTHSHPLADYQGPRPGMNLFPGQEYSDARVRDFADVRHWDVHLIDKTTVPRMPWHDISLCVTGGPVLDVARHFCERWNFIKNEKALKKDYVPFLEPPLGGYAEHQRVKIPVSEFNNHLHHRFHHGTHGVKGTCRAQVLRSVGDWSMGFPTEHSIQNAYIATITNARHYVYIENQFFITANEGDPDYFIKNQIGQAIVKRIIRAHEEQEKFKVIVVMPLMPAFPADLSTKEGATARLIMNYQYLSICRGGKSIYDKLRQAGIVPTDYIRFYSLRSYDRINRRKLEEMLARAAGYSAAHLEEQVQSLEITDETICTRSVEVFDADACIASDSIAKYAMKGSGDLNDEPWLLDTTYSQPRGEAAEKAERDGYVSEEAYIHAKILIADDKIVIMGSANLNDRSQCGDRDSEIALLVEDQDVLPSRMSGRHYEASTFAATLRRQLWKEHLGLLPDMPVEKVVDAMEPLPKRGEHFEQDEDYLVLDPLDDEVLALWNQTAATNTEAFRNVFHCVPDDNVTTWDEYHAFYPSPDKIDIGHVYDPTMPVAKIRSELSRVRGHIVEFPTKFLENVDLDSESVPFVSSAVQDLYT